MKLSPSFYELMNTSGSGKAFLFLDYDGTLAEFAPNPDVVLPDQEIIGILKKIKKMENLNLAIISGRRLAHIQSLVPISGIWLAGSYGVELIDPSGKEIHRLDFNDLRPKLISVKPFWNDLIKGKKDYYLEDKGWSLAIHANGSDKDEVALILQKAGEINVPTGFHLKKTHNFIEICPPEANKGASVEFILAKTKIENGLPIFIGDDPRDEDAFISMRDLGGVGIIVSESERKTAAKYYLENPAKVRNWLKEIY